MTALPTWFVAVYAHSWGRGRTADEAKKQARKAGGRGDEWYVKQLPDGAKDPYVDDLGGIVWGWEDAEPEGYVHAQLPIVAMGRGAKRNAAKARKNLLTS